MEELKLSPTIKIKAEILVVGPISRGLLRDKEVYCGFSHNCSELQHRN
jgi:hypothetical protein